MIRVLTLASDGKISGKNRGSRSSLTCVRAGPAELDLAVAFPCSYQYSGCKSDGPGRRFQFIQFSDPEDTSMLPRIILSGISPIKVKKTYIIVESGEERYKSTCLIPLAMIGPCSKGPINDLERYKQAEPTEFS